MPPPPPPAVSSLVENIFVALLFYSSDRLQYKNAHVFYTVIDELKFLQREGIILDTRNGKQQIFFSLGLITGDNLDSNSILGFTEEFNANYNCRLCKTTKLRVRIDFDENNWREETYESDVAKLNSKETGIKEASIWNNVDYFETARNIYTDWLNERPEGAAGYDMALILHHYVIIFFCLYYLTSLPNKP